MRALADDRLIVIKKAEKGSTVMVWDSNDYILEAEKQLTDLDVYKDVSFNKRFCRNLWEQVISFFKTSNLKEKLVINSLNT